MANVTPSWNVAAHEFLERIARDDPDEVVRLQAEDARWYLMGEHELEEVSW
jgi:hypothetical protein